MVAELAGDGSGDADEPRNPVVDLMNKAITRTTMPPGWDENARLLLSAWVLEPHLDNERMDLLFESLAAEPVPVRRR